MAVSWGVAKAGESRTVFPGREEDEKPCMPGRGKIVQRTENRFGGCGGEGGGERGGSLRRVNADLRHGTGP